MYQVIRDTREQKNNGWTFVPTANCSGMKVETLPTGDYTLVGFEKLFVIERKKNTSELAKNIYEERFEKELIRMEAFAYPFMVLEFSMADIIGFPRNSGIPTYLWSKIKTTPWFLLRKFTEYNMKYRTKIILAGSNGKEVASSLFKWVVELTEGKDCGKASNKVARSSRNKS